MKRLAFLLLLLLFTVNFYSQEEPVLSKKEQRKLAKEQKKAKRAEEDEKARELTKIMVENHRFVLEADYVGNKTGQRVPVASNLNFVIIDSTKSTLQLGGYQGIGVNGVGGVTVDGHITKYELKKVETKRGYFYSLIINLMTSIGNYDITLSISELGNADAIVRGSVSGQLRYYGRLVPLGLSRIYKGSSIP